VVRGVREWAAHNEQEGTGDEGGGGGGVRVLCVHGKGKNERNGKGLN
jgi:hypothetical protein